MKKLLIGALTVLLSTSLFAMDIFNYVPVTGNVKNYTQTDYAITTKFGNYYRTPSSKSIHTLNTSGKEVEVTELTPKDVVIEKIVTKYDLYGNLTEQAAYNSESVLMWKNVITYNGSKKVDSSEYGKDGVLKAKTIYTYEENNLVDETGYDGEGALAWKIIYKYTEDNKLDVMYEYNGDGSLSRKETYAYTESGKIESITIYDNFSNETEMLVFRYASNGTITEVTTYGNDNQITKRTLIKYDASGNVGRVSDYAVAEKFGTTVNELIFISEYSYQ